MKTAYILIGASGAGKSTWTAANVPDAVVCSADHHFMRNGRYEFDPAQLGAAHAECLRAFVEAVRAPPALEIDELIQAIVVDNTNTTIAEVAPYLAVAQAYDLDVKAIFFGTPPEVCVQRADKGAPDHTVWRQHFNAEMLKRAWPPFWPRITVVGMDPA